MQPHNTNTLITNLRALLPDRHAAISYLHKHTIGPLNNTLRDYLQQHNIPSLGVWTPQGWRPQLVLRDYDTELTLLFAQLFGPFRGVSFGSGNILQTDIDALIVPVNTAITPSTGLLRSCIRTFGSSILQRLRSHAADIYPLSALPVERSISIPIHNHPSIHTLIATSIRASSFEPHPISPTTFTNALASALTHATHNPPRPITRLGLTSLTPPSPQLTRSDIAHTTKTLAQRILHLQPLPERD